jgi:hypothetical protein
MVYTSDRPKPHEKLYRVTFARGSDLEEIGFNATLLMPRA